MLMLQFYPIIQGDNIKLSWAILLYKEYSLMCCTNRPYVLTSEKLLVVFHFQKEPACLSVCRNILKESRTEQSFFCLFQNRWYLRTFQCFMSFDPVCLWGMLSVENYLCHFVLSNRESLSVELYDPLMYDFFF